MARIQQSIDVAAPVHAVYQRLTQFEDYPRFMQDVENVQQLDDTHLHWAARMENQRIEWDAEITEQDTDRCIAWRNMSGPANAGKVEVQALGADTARVTLTIESETGPAASPSGGIETAMAQRLGRDLAHFKQWIEDRTAESRQSAQSGHPVEDAFDPPRAADATYAAYAASAEAGAGLAQQINEPMQSNAALSRSSDVRAEDERFSVAEEVNFDQQSDQVRRVGQMPQDSNAAAPAEAMAKSMKQGDTKDDAKLKQSIERAVPPSE